MPPRLPAHLGDALAHYPLGELRTVYHARARRSSAWVFALWGLRHTMAEGTLGTSKGAAKAANVGCAAVAFAVVLFLTLGLPLIAVLSAK